MGACVAFLLIGAVALIFGFAVLGNSALAENVPWEARIGECFGRDGSQRSIPCSGPHHYEVFMAAEFEADVPYPDRFDTTVGVRIDVCEEELESLTGRGYFDPTSPWDYGVVYPTEADWARGERVVICAAFDVEFRQLDGPLTGSG